MSNASSIVPKERPKLTQDALRALIKNVDRNKYPIVVVGIRAYYLSMGKANANDRDIYDDAIFIDTPNLFKSFNANTDPTRYLKGTGFGATKGMASLNEGLWQAHQFGIHKGEYPALIQTGGKVTVTRDGDPPYQDTGFFGINIHKGGWTITSSEGCQTIYPGEWDDFINTVTNEAIKIFGVNAYKSKIIPYRLILNDGSISH